jgi:tetratricopeptide (TPR) repeat protein
VLLYDKGDYAAAEPMLRDALQIRRKKFPNGNEEVAFSLVELGRLLIDRGNPQEAEALLREGLEIRRNKLAAGHWLIAEAESVLGGCLTALRRYDEAEPLLAESCTVIKAKRGEQDIQTQRALARLVKLYTVTGKPDKAALYRSNGGNK